MEWVVLIVVVALVLAVLISSGIRLERPVCKVCGGNSLPQRNKTPAHRRTDLSVISDSFHREFRCAHSIDYELYLRASRNRRSFWWL
jgi:hypothetical protein